MDGGFWLFMRLDLGLSEDFEASVEANFYRVIEGVTVICKAPDWSRGGRRGQSGASGSWSSLGDQARARGQFRTRGVDTLGRLGHLGSTAVVLDGTRQQGTRWQ